MDKPGPSRPSKCRRETQPLIKKVFDGYRYNKDKESLKDPSVT